MSNVQVEYKTKLPAVKLPYYRLTIYLDEEYDQYQELQAWFDWIKSHSIPCAIAMGTAANTYSKLAVWVWGREHHELSELENVETMGRIVLSSEWPIDVEQHNSL